MELLITKPPSATTARLRIVIDDLIHLILGLQLPARAAMPGLTTCLALAAQQLLRLRPGLRPTLLTRLRRILRWRLGTRARVPARLLLKPLQPIPVQLNRGREIKDELNTRLTPRVIDRLRFSAIHDCKIRCTNEESLPDSPTTERLESAGINRPERRR